MKLSDKGLMALIAHEGIVQSRYKDSKGIWTIGGHTRHNAVSLALWKSH